MSLNTHTVTSIKEDKNYRHSSFLMNSNQESQTQRGPRTRAQARAERERGDRPSEHPMTTRSKERAARAEVLNSVDAVQSLNEAMLEESSTLSAESSVASTLLISDSVASTVQLDDSVASTAQLNDSVASTMQLNDSVASTMQLNDSVASTVQLNDSLQASVQSPPVSPLVSLPSTVLSSGYVTESTQSRSVSLAPTIAPPPISPVPQVQLFPGPPQNRGWCVLM